MKTPSAPTRPAARAADFAAAAFFLAVLLGAAFFVGWIGAGPAFVLVAIGVLALALWYYASGRSGVVAMLTEDDAEEVRRLRRYSVLMDSLPQPVLLLDGEDRVEVANASAERAFGTGIEGQHITQVIRAPSALEVVREARHDGEPHEAEFTLTAPRELAALCYAAPLDGEPDETGGEVVVMIRDRTEQRKLERMRTDFIANASHELRTPLASILGFIETLQGHAKDDEAARARFLGIMQSQTERMLRLVKDLVSLSALELNERRLPQTDVDLCEVAQTVQELMDPVGRQEGSEVVYDPGPTCPCPIMGDRDQLIQVLQNLVDNAFKYGGEAGSGPARVHLCVGEGIEPAFEGADRSGDSPEQIAVRMGCRPAELRWVRVRDEGPGIEKTDLPRLTERFYRIDVERSRTRGGTGLGLAIVKHIVGRHRGGILIESKTGHGAAFTCYFPPKGALDLDTVEAGR